MCEEKNNMKDKYVAVFCDAKGEKRAKFLVKNQSFCNQGEYITDLLEARTEAIKLICQPNERILIAKVVEVIEVKTS